MQLRASKPWGMAGAHSQRKKSAYNREILVNVEIYFLERDSMGDR